MVTVFLSWKISSFMLGFLVYYNFIIYFHIYFSVLNMASDMVANVRFNVAKTLTIIGPKLNSSVMTAQIKPVLSKWF